MPYADLLPFDSSLLLPITLIIAVAAFAHGLIGVGFPLISTPCIAMFTDLRTAIVITILPNLALNLVAIIKGGNWQHSLKQHWRLAIYVLVGSLIGTQLLVGLPTEPLKLMLAAVMIVSANSARLRQLDWSRLLRHKHGAEALFGIMGGILSGVVNISVPVLAIYFLGLELGVTAMTQLYNLCFIVGKITQASTLAYHGAFTVNSVILGAAFTILSTACQYPGMRIQSGMETHTYRRWMDRTILAMAIMLIAQVMLK